MSLVAPPKPPSDADPPDLDALEALIEEARRRARRRRQRYAGGALLALLAGLAVYVGFARGGGDGAKNVRTGASGTASAREARASSLSFRLLSVETAIRFVDRPPKGVLNKGDAIYVRSVLRNGWTHQFGRPRNAVVGRDSWVRTGLSKPGWELITVKVWLPGGTLRLRGRGQFYGQTTCKVQERSNLPSLNDYELRLPK